MNKSAESKDGRKAASAGQLWLRLPGLVREALYDTVIGAGLACVDEVLEAERVALCGERYAHLVDREALRAGPVASSLVLGGRRVGVKRPRVRLLSSTNLIENLFSRVHEIGRRVKHWQSGTMVLRWTAAGVLEAERGFRNSHAVARCRPWSLRCAPTILNSIMPDWELTKLRKPLN